MTEERETPSGETPHDTESQSNDQLLIFTFQESQVKLIKVFLFS